TEAAHSTGSLTGDERCGAAELAFAPGNLPVGEGSLEVAALVPGSGAPPPQRAPFVVSFSDQWAITNFDEMISLLRYFDRQDWVDSLRKASVADRPSVWRRFYKATDPVPMTPENEALDQYFRRVQTANQRFQESGDPGWLTDRGEVFITLGEPDDVFDFSSDVSRSGVRGVRWTYSSLRLTLFFQDQTGFGRFRLTPMSRAEYQRVLARVRRYDRARGLLAGQPWLGEYADGAGLAVLAEAEARLGRASEAAGHYAAARAHAPGARGALLAVRAALAWEAGGEKDSAAAAYGAARTAGLAVIDSWLRVRQARVTRDTAVAFRL